MEQRLDAIYLRPGPFERATAIGIVAVAIGTGILLATWGISFLWRYAPPEIVVRQDKPFEIKPPEPLRIDPDATIKVEPPPPVPNVVGGDTKTSTGEVIKREVTVFWSVTHGPGEVVTGWKYADGRGGNPVHQYCYYSAPNADHSSRKIDIASNRIPSPNINDGLVPDLEGALAKCRWGRV